MFEFIDELKLNMDKEKEMLDKLKEECKQQERNYLAAKAAYEKEFYKGKTCNSCIYSVVLDFSFDGWHNLCGCDDAPCTCCHDHCEHYKPDNLLTSKLKEVFKENDYPIRSLEPDDVEGLKSLGIDIFSPSDNEEILSKTAEKVVDILRLAHKW